jgi:hypothetical protein
MSILNQTNIDIITKIMSSPKGCKFTKDNLDSLAAAYNAKIIAHTLPLEHDSIITFNCQCGSENIAKLFKSCVVYSMLCTPCSRKCDKPKLEKREPKYTLQNLVEIMDKHSAVLLDSFNVIDTSKPFYIKKELSINFRCRCGVATSKTFRKIIENDSAMCQKCVLIRSINKIRESTGEKTTPNVLPVVETVPATEVLPLVSTTKSNDTYQPFMIGGNAHKYSILSILDKLSESGAKQHPDESLLNTDSAPQVYKKIDRNAQLKFICKCGNEGTKSVRKIVETMANCTSCRHREGNEKLMDKNEKTYGVRCNFNRTDVKEKIASKKQNTPQ